MFIAKELIAKGLLATAATATAITLGVVYGDNIAKYLSSESEDKLLEGVGLSCDLSTASETNGVECSKKVGEGVVIKVKNGETKFDVSTITTGSKIKVYKTTSSQSPTYEKNLKFVIEGGDISVTSGDTTNKLKEFETYGIEKDGEEWRLTRKTDVNVEIKKALGLPEDSSCNLPTTTGNEVECDITGDKFKNIKFEGLVKTQASVEGTPKLKISKVEDTNNDYGNYKLKFVLESATDVTIASGTSIRGGTNTEFKIKVSGEANQYPRTLSLEKAWTVAKLAEKIGVAANNGCTAETANPKECTIGTTINVFKDSNNHIEGATVTNANTQKLTFETGVADHNQGYKFTAASAISLNDPATGTGTKVGEVSIEASTASASYEIKEQTVGTAKK